MGGHGGDTCGVEVFEVIGGQRAHARGHLCAAKVRQLLGVEADWQPQRLRFGENAGDLIDAESYPLAKGVNPIGQAFGGDGGQHIVADMGDVIVWAACIFRRQRVGAKEGGDDADGAHFAQSPRGAQHGDFGCRIEAIARFDLDRAEPLGHQGIKPGEGTRHQFIDAGRTCGAHRRDDAAACARYVLIARPFKPGLPFDRAVAAVDDMGVAIDQRGGDQSALAGDGAGGGERRGLVCGAGIENAAIACGDHAIGHLASAQQPGIGPDRVARGGLGHIRTFGMRGDDHCMGASICIDIIAGQRNPLRAC